MKKGFLIFILLLACISVFGKSKKKTEVKQEKPSSPVWMTDEGRLSMFPSNSYLSAFAFGGTADAAKNKAAETLSESIKSQVTSSVNYSVTNDDYSVSQDSTVKTDNLMFSTEYTTPYYSEYHGMYCVTAFIDRTKAFNYVKPKLDAAAGTFPPYYKEALLLEDDFDKIISINRARKTLADFYEVYDFARVISPQKTALYEEVNTLCKQSEITSGNLKRNVIINVNVQNDPEGKFKAALSDFFTRNGFTVSDKNSNYECISTVDLNSQNKTARTVEIYPSYSVEVINKNTKQVKLACTRKLEKTAGFDAGTAERRAKLAVENDIKNELVKEF